MNTVQGKNIIIAGGAGFVGDGITRALLSAGAHVLIVSCSDQCIKKLDESLSAEQKSRLNTIHARIGTDDGDKILSNRLNDGTLWHGAVACLGKWASQGPIVDLNPNELKDLIFGNLISHIRFMQLALPRISDGGQYIQINGIGMDKPIPNAGIMSVFDAATHMLKNVAAEEWQYSNISVYTLAIQNHVMSTSAEKDSASTFTPEQIGQRVTELLGNAHCTHRHGRTLRWAHPWQQMP